MSKDQSIKQLLQDAEDLEMEKVEALLDDRLSNIAKVIGDMIRVVEGKGKFGRKSSRRFLWREISAQEGGRRHGGDRRGYHPSERV